MDMEFKKGYWWPKGTSEKAVDFQIGNLRSAEKLFSYCKQFRGIVVAGGNLGLFPKWFATKFNSVWTFEPDRVSFNCLVKNVEDHENVIPMPIALAERTTFVEMEHIHDSNHRVIGFRQGTVPALALDTFEYYYDALCLDVEGCELYALRGAQRSLTLNRPVIMLEIREELLKFYGIKVPQIQEVLASYNYVQVDGVGHDFVYLPKEKVGKGK